MTQDKMRQTITAVVVAATLWLVILLSVLIYQWVTIGVLNRRKAKLETEIGALEQQKQEKQLDAEWYEANKFLLAIENGWVYEQGDK